MGGKSEVSKFMFDNVTTNHKPVQVYIIPSDDAESLKEELRRHSNEITVIDSPLSMSVERGIIEGFRFVVSDYVTPTPKLAVKAPPNDPWYRQQSRRGRRY